MRSWNEALEFLIISFWVVCAAFLFVSWFLFAWSFFVALCWFVLWISRDLTLLLSALKDSRFQTLPFIKMYIFTFMLIVMHRGNDCVCWDYVEEKALHQYKAACWQLVEHRGPTLLSHYVFLKKNYDSNILKSFRSGRNVGKQKGQNPKKITNLEKRIKQSFFNQLIKKTILTFQGWFCNDNTATEPSGRFTTLCWAGHHAGVVF